jgi:hypothetical protein
MCKYIYVCMYTNIKRNYTRVYYILYTYSDSSQTFRRYPLKKVGDFNKTDNLFLSQKRKCAYTGGFVQRRRNVRKVSKQFCRL